MHKQERKDCLMFCGSGLLFVLFTTSIAVYSKSQKKELPENVTYNQETKQYHAKYKVGN
jgi:hypothetical protein